MSEKPHEGPTVKASSPRLNEASAGEKRKGLSPPREEQGGTKRIEANTGEQSKPEKSQSFRKVYAYSEEDRKRKSQKDYQGLHEIHTYLKTGEVPSRVKGGTSRFNFKRKTRKFVLLESELYLKRKHKPCRVLWEQEVFPTLESCHKEWAHYPKDKGKFRVKVEERFFFPQLSNVTAAFIAACPDCQKEKAGRAERTDREMNPSPPVSPFFRVHLDLCGYFLDAKKKKKYIAVCIDAVTKFASARVLPNKRAATVAKAFREEILLRHGCPFEVVTDQGTEFREEFESLLRAESLKHVKVRPRNPKANGQVERFMQLLKSTLRIMCNSKPSDWERPSLL